MSDLVLTLPNGKTRHLNPFLVFKQRLSQDKVDEIKFKHGILWATKQAAQLANHQGDWLSARKHARLVDKLDEELQLLWGFTPDPLRRSHWCDISGCTCAEHEPGKVRNIDPGCPFHGV